MADKRFSIPLANSFRWYPVNPVQDERYNSVPFEFQDSQYNPNGEYCDKWQKNDIGVPTQVLSDWPLTMSVYSDRTGFVKDVPINSVSTALIGVTFLCYQNIFDWSDPDLTAGDCYYLTIQYTDDDLNEIVWRTSCLCLEDIHPDTVLISYKNTYNTAGVIFQPTGIEMCFRVEGWVTNYVPGSEDELFTDQKHNVTTEFGLPFRTFTFFIGLNSVLIPDWKIDKTNIAFAFDQKRINNVYYSKLAQDTKFVPLRTDGKNKDAQWSIEVIPNEDFFLDSYNVGDNPNENDLQVIRRSKQYLLNDGNIACANVFKKFTTLIGLQIDNRDLEVFTITVGTSLAGTELGVYELTGEICDYIEIVKGFDSVKTVYIGGLTGHDTDVTIVYDQLDDRTTVPDSGGGGFVKGTAYVYIEQEDGDFENDWNSATGLGNDGTKYAGCSWYGRNGLPDLKGMAFIGWDYLDPAGRDSVVGVAGNQLTITRANLPSEGLEMFTGDVNHANGDTPGNLDNVARARDNNSSGGSSNLNYELSKSHDSSSWVGRTKNMGSGTPLDITPYGKKVVYFTKLSD